MEAVKRVLAHRVKQIMAIKAEDHALEEMGVNFQRRTELYPETIPSIFGNMVHQVKPLLEEKK
jgi:hypothetical protein